MAADLTFNGFLRRKSLVLMDNDLVALDHYSTQDRVRRIALNRVANVLTWRGLPWVRIFVYMFLYGAPVIVLFSLGDPTANVIGMILLCLMILVQLRYFYMRQTTIRVTRADQQFDFKGVVSPRKVTRFLGRLEDHIRQTQYDAEQRILARQAERAEEAPSA